MRPVVSGLMSGIVADSTKVEEQPTTTRGLVEQTSKKLSKQVSWLHILTCSFCDQTLLVVVTELTMHVCMQNCTCVLIAAE
jgi:hypothetical protein